MNNNSAVVDYQTESESAQLVTDDTQNTDFTQIACCAFGDKSVETGKRQDRSDRILESTPTEQAPSGSVKHFFARVFGFK